MTSISMTRFIDFSLKSGPARCTSLRTTKKQIAAGYHPATDFYKLLRDRIVYLHKNNQPAKSLKSFINTITDQKKLSNYPDAINGYAKFLTKQTKAGPVTFSTPPTGLWQIASNLAINVNPELSLTMSGQQHIIKLHFKAEKPKSGQLDACCQLMLSQLSPHVPVGTNFCVLDVRSAKLTCTSTPDPVAQALLLGDAAAVVALYPVV